MHIQSINTGDKHKRGVKNCCDRHSWSTSPGQSLLVNNELSSNFVMAAMCHHTYVCAQVLHDAYTSLRDKNHKCRVLPQFSAQFFYKRVSLESSALRTYVKNSLDSAVKFP